MKWKGDKAVLAANRRMSVEAELARLTWARGAARRMPAVVAGIRTRQLANLASRAAVDAGITADNTAETRQAGRYALIEYQANFHARKAHLGAHKVESYLKKGSGE